MNGSEAGTGVLAIWHDCAPGGEEDYERWYRDEHLAERVGIEGFVAGWRYGAEEGSPGWFVHYQTRTPEVLFSDAYLARVNAPSPLTRRIMDGILVNQSRTVCERTRRFGEQRGALAVTVRIARPTADAALEATLASLARSPEVLRGELWTACEVPEGATALSAEQRIRGRDARIDACLVLECTRLDDARRVRAALGDLPGEAGIYRLLSSLHRCDLR